MQIVIRKKDMVMRLMNNMLVDLPSPSSISYLWNFGSLLGVYLLVQILTGLFLAMHFSGDMVLSFYSIVHIIRDVNFGWFIRVLHSNGASMFFMFLYIHIGRGIYYGSYRMRKTWISGVTIFIISMITAFLGYVLPWGQMSFWAATVITNLLSAVPYIGTMLVEWIWGGYAVSNPTLTRFFSFHFTMPFLILGLVILHLGFLHEMGSSNPLGLCSDNDKVSFHPFYSIKDLIGVILAFFILILISLFWPYIFMDCENFIPSNPLVTPVHIQPEWYFLFAYCILRSISSSIGGVLALLMSVLILYSFPFFFKHKVQSLSFYLGGSLVFWMFVSVWLMLTWIGACEVEDPFSMLGSFYSIMYFSLLFVMWVMLSIQDYFML